MTLPPDWEFFTGIAFHANLVNPKVTDIKKIIIRESINLGIEMAEAVEKKRDSLGDEDV